MIQLKQPPNIEHFLHKIIRFTQTFQVSIMPLIPQVNNLPSLVYLPRLMSRCRLCLMVLVAVLCLGNTAELKAGGGPENVLLVVNSSSKTSMAVANLYVRLRKIPAINVVNIAWAGSKVKVSVSDFRSKILMPIITQMAARKIAGQIDYIVYSSNFPYTVDLTAEWPAQLMASLKNKKRPPRFAPLVSINSATYFWQSVLAKKKTQWEFLSCWG